MINSIKKLLPPKLKTWLRIRKQMFELERLSHSDYHTSNLWPFDRDSLNHIFSDENSELWKGVESKMSDFEIPEMAEGVNQGDTL